MGMALVILVYITGIASLIYFYHTACNCFVYNGYQTGQVKANVQHRKEKEGCLCISSAIFVAFGLLGLALWLCGCPILMFKLYMGFGVMSFVFFSVMFFLLSLGWRKEEKLVPDWKRN